MHTHWEWPTWRCWARYGRSLEVSFNSRQLSLWIDESHIHLAMPFFQIFVPYPGSKHQDDTDVNHEWQYGVSAFYDTIHLHWGYWTGVYWWPWANWIHVRHDILSEPETHDYIYRLKSGEIQERKATIKVEEREWRLFRSWSPILRIIRYIDVEFDQEVGEETGSWKGGTVGCGYNMLPNETALQALRRMERERKF